MGFWGSDLLSITDGCDWFNSSYCVTRGVLKFIYNDISPSDCLRPIRCIVVMKVLLKSFKCEVIISEPKWHKWHRRNRQALQNVSNRNIFSSRLDIFPMNQTKIQWTEPLFIQIQTFKNSQEKKNHLIWIHRILTFWRHVYPVTSVFFQKRSFFSARDEYGSQKRNI